MLTWLIMLLLVVLLIAAIPSWPHSRGWGYAPSGVIATVLAIALVLLLLGYF